MTREVQDSGVRITPVTITETTNQQTSTTNIEGILVEMKAGLLPTSHTHEDGGSHSNTGGIWVESDYTLELRHQGSNNCLRSARIVQTHRQQRLVSQHRSLRYDGISCKGDSGVSINGWFSMPGDANDDAYGTIS